LELPPRLYEVFGLHAKLSGNADEIGLMRFKKAQEGRQQGRFVGSLSQLIRPDSGQVDEPSCPPVVTKRCRQCGERDCDGVIVVRGQHSLRQPQG